MDWIKEALAGVEEEQREHWRQWRMRNCGKPHRWIWDMQAKKHIPIIWHCGEAECEVCRKRRAYKEEARMMNATEQNKYVYTFHCTDQEWPKVLRQFTYRGITKDKYRRLPLVEGSAIFFVCDDLDFVELLEVEVMTDSTPPKWTEQDDWYELARKKPGKRTSGALGDNDDEQEKSEEDGWHSYQVPCVCSEDAKEEHVVEAAKEAEEKVKDDEPKTHEEVMEICSRWANIFEAALQKHGYDTRQMMIWRKWKITSLRNTKEENDVKSPPSWLQDALDGAKEELARLGNEFEPVSSFA